MDIDRGLLVCEDNEHKFVKESKGGYEIIEQLPITEDNSYYFKSSHTQRCDNYRINNKKLKLVANDEYHVEKCKQVPTHAFIDNKGIIRTDCFQSSDDNYIDEAENRCKLYGHTLEHTEMCLPVYKNGEALYGNQTRGVCKSL